MLSRIYWLLATGAAEEDVWENLSPKKILSGDDSGFIRGMAKTFFALAIVGLVVTALIAIAYYAWGGSKKGEGKDLLMSKLLTAMVLALGIALLDAIFMIATGIW